MPSVLDQSVAIGKEATYGTRVDPTRGYEVTADDWQRDVEQLENTGLRSGKHTILADRRRPIDLGATGALEGAVTTSGMGLLLAGLLGTASGPSQIGNSGAYSETFATNSVGPSSSYSVQVARVDSAGTTRVFDYSGAVATGFNFAADAGAEFTYRIDYAAQGEDVGTLTPPVYPADNQMFIYSDLTLSVNDVATTSITSFSFDGDLGLDVDRRFLRGNARRLRPIRSGEPTFSGTLTAEFADLALWQIFKDGTNCSLKLRAETSKAIGQDGTTSVFPSLEITMPTCRLDGSSPTASTTDLTTLDAPFTVVWDGVNPAVEITYTSADSTN